jgi:hypothetical protein
VVHVIGAIMRDAEEAFGSEVNFGKEKDVNVVD